MNDNERDAVEPITDRLAEGLATLATGAQRTIAEALARLPATHRQQLMGAVDAGRCTLTLQVDFPALDVRVLADGEGWLKPQVLFALDRKARTNDTTNRH